MKYIDADKLIALIDAKLEDLGLSGSVWVGRSVLQDLKEDIITSLQQDQPDKVDFEDVWKTYYDNHLFLRSPMPSKRDIARHFYELGLKARKL